MLLPNPHRPGRMAPADLPLPGGISPGLARGRLHELCGPSRMALALLLLAGTGGPVIWVAPSWLPERPYACGMRDYLDPGRLILVRCRRVEDVQWSAEEALRSGAAPTVLIDMPAPPSLTPVRRLHLAAETGAGAARQGGRPAPVGLLLTPGDGGAQGVESRWQASPLPAPSGLMDSRGIALRLERRRARAAPPQAWVLCRTPDGAVQARDAPPPRAGP